MKTRIISGIVMGVIVAAVLVAGFLISPYIITVAIALLAAGAIYELLHNAAGIKCKTSIIGACAFSVLFIFASDDKIREVIYTKIPYDAATIMAKPEDNLNRIINYENFWSLAIISLIVLYFIFAVFMIFKNHKNFSLGQIAALCGFPLPYAFAFSCLGSVIGNQNGIYYLLLLLNFSSVCDMGAYFTGVTIGKHKLCPNLSPKKTVEGAIGGIVSSVIVTLIITLCFKTSIVLPLILTIPLCILGMVGDLFASAIKRAVGIKDYGNLIPGHGGILDRVDSILMIVPLMYLMMTFGVL